MIYKILFLLRTIQYCGKVMEKKKMEKNRQMESLFFSSKRNNSRNEKDATTKQKGIKTRNERHKSQLTKREIS